MILTTQFVTEIIGNGNIKIMEDEIQTFLLENTSKSLYIYVIMGTNSSAGSIGIKIIRQKKMFDTVLNNICIT